MCVFKNVFCQRVEFGGGAQIEPGYDPSHDKLREREQIGKVDGSKHARGHQIWRVACENVKQHEVQEKEDERRQD